MKLMSLLVLILTITSCATPQPLSPEESAIRILTKSDAPLQCKEVGKVHAPGLASFTEEGRENDLKQATHKIGGNLVVLERRDENNTLFGTAFKCP